MWTIIAQSVFLVPTSRVVDTKWVAWMRFFVLNRTYISLAAYISALCVRTTYTCSVQVF